MSAALCACATCCALDLAFPNEGVQLALLASSRLDVEANKTARLPAKRSPPPKARQAWQLRAGACPVAGAENPSPEIIPAQELTTRRKTMSVTTMTIDALCVSPFNARINAADANAVAGMAESLMASGQLYPLAVHPIKASRKTQPRYGVLAGGRRFRAFTQLIEQGRLPVDHPIDVIIRDIRDEGELRELSLAENLVRVELRPYEVYAAVARAHNAGRSLKLIADTNGQPMETVRRWARLGNLHPTVFQALETGEIGQDLAKAIGATEDVALQLHVFEQLMTFGEHQRTPAAARRLLKIGDGQLEKLLRFIGDENYTAAGGRYELDLFADQAEARGRVADEGLLMQLADAKLEAARELIRVQCGRILRFEKSPPMATFAGYENGVAQDLEIRAEPQPATPADADRLAFLENELIELDALCERSLDDPTLTDAVRAARIAALEQDNAPLEEEMRAIHARMTLDLPAGDIFATLTVQADGKLETRFWWADRRAKRKAEEAARKSPDAPEPRPVSTGPNVKPLAPEQTPIGKSPTRITGGAAIDRDYGYSLKQHADAGIRDEHGLTAEGVQIMRSIRREMLRAMLVLDSQDMAAKAPVAQDYLIWSLARERYTGKGAMVPGQRSYERGMAGLSVRQETLPGDVATHVDRTEAHAVWQSAVERLRAHDAMTEPDLVAAFNIFIENRMRGKARSPPSWPEPRWSDRRALAAMKSNSTIISPCSPALAKQNISGLWSNRPKN